MVAPVSRSTRRKLSHRTQLTALIVVAALITLELGARAALWWLLSDESFRQYASTAQLTARYGAFSPFQVHRHLGFSLSPGYERDGNQHNLLGFRGEEITLEKPPGTRRVVCAGGSTTYGWGTRHDFRLSYPWKLQEQLEEAGSRAEVINAGCPGWTTLQTLTNFETRVLDLDPDVLVVYHGMNDALTRLVWPGEAHRSDRSGWLNRQNARRPASLLEESTFARMILVRCGAITSHSSLLRIIGDRPATSYFYEFLEQRRHGRYPDGMFRDVPIERMLETNRPVFFERNLRSLVAVAETHGVKVVLCTFAVSRKAPHRPYVGHPGIRRALAEQNEIVRLVARETPATLLDVAASLPDEPGIYVDGMHFTADANARRARQVRDHVLRLLR